MGREHKKRKEKFSRIEAMIFLMLIVIIMSLQPVFAQSQPYHLSMTSDLKTINLDSGGIATIKIRLEDINGEVPPGDFRLMCETSVGTLSETRVKMDNGQAEIKVNVRKSVKTTHIEEAQIAVMIVETDNVSLLGLTSVISIPLVSDSEKDNQNNTQTVNRDAVVISTSAVDIKSVKMEFSNALKEVSKDNFKIYKGVTVTSARLTNGGRTVILAVEGAQYDTVYTITVSGLKQKDGGGVQQSVLGFTTPPKPAANTQTDVPNEEQPVIQDSSLAQKQKITCTTDMIKNGKVVYGARFSLQAKASGNTKLTYKSNNSKVLSVNASGKVVAKKYGNASITIKAAAGNGYQAAKKTILLKVVPKQVKIIKAQWSKDHKAYFEWKQDKTAEGYEYSFAYNPEFDPDIKGESVGKKNHISMGDFKELKQGGIYIRVRAYKTIAGNRCYGEWSAFRYLAI